MPNTIAYLRVSKIEQELGNQRLEIEKYAESKELKVNTWIEVEISTRKSTEARKIDELLKSLKKGDVLIVSELSRLARSMRQTNNICHDISQRKAELHIIKQNLIVKDKPETNTKVILWAFGLAAELERDLISQRTIAGLERARAAGKTLGNPRLHIDNQKSIARANKFAEKLRPVIESFIAKGLTQRQIVIELNKLDIRTSRDCQFYLKTIQDILKRLKLKTNKKLAIAAYAYK